MSESSTRLAFLVQLGATLPLVGLIWFVQIVAYPLFLRVSPADFPTYHAAHSRLITFIVGPLMLAELLASFAWVLMPPAGLPRWFTVAGFGFALATWIFTMALAVPRHNALAQGFDAEVIRSLIGVNWLRTIAWTARGGILLWVAARYLSR